jgi:hypothetical protein
VHALTIHRPGQSSERRAVTAPLRAGGSQADEILLPGAVPSALRLVPRGAGLVVEAIASGLRVAGRPVQPGSRRLLRPGERAELHGFVLALDPPPATDATRVAARAVLRDAARGGGAAAGPRVVVLTGPAAGARHALRGDQTLGRGRRAAIRIPDAQASRLHARLRLSAEGATVEDLASKNGVRVNGVRIEPGAACALGPGDELGIGETALAVEGIDPTTAAAPTGPARPAARRPRPAPHLLAAALLALSAAALAVAAG